MKKLITTLLLALLTISVDGYSQTLRINGYAGELVFQDSHRIPVFGATMPECRHMYEEEKDRYDPHGSIGLYTGRDGNQPCVPQFVYRSPTAPSASPIPALVLWPEIPVPPLCLSCLWFDDFDNVIKLYPNHAGEVKNHIKHFKIDQYNQAIREVQDKYLNNIEGFEQKMFALDEYLAEKEAQ